MEKENAPAPKPKKKPSGKAAPKKKSAGKKTRMKKAAAPKASSKKKKAPGSKAEAKKAAPGAAAKRKPAAKPKAKKTAVSRKKPVSIRDLLAKKFDMPAPAKKYAPPSAGKGRDRVSSPPFFTGETQEETERVRRLLFKRFDVTPSEEKSDAGSGPEPKPETPKVASSPSRQPMDSDQKIASIGIGILVLLLALVMWSSASNAGKYYMKTVSGDVEIWKGRFSPRGAEKIFTLDKAALPADLKEVYGKEEAFPMIFEGIVNNTDALLNREEIPGFDFIRGELEKARPYAVSDQMSARLQRRMDKIDMMALVYKADVLAEKGTTVDLKHAREALEKTLALNLDEAEKGLVEQKIAWIDQKLLEVFDR